MKLLPAVFISFVADAKEKKVKIDIRESESQKEESNSFPKKILQTESREIECQIEKNSHEFIGIPYSSNSVRSLETLPVEF